MRSHPQDPHPGRDSPISDNEDAHTWHARGTHGDTGTEQTHARGTHGDTGTEQMGTRRRTDTHIDTYLSQQEAHMNTQRHTGTPNPH